MYSQVEDKFLIQLAILESWESPQDSKQSNDTQAADRAWIVMTVNPLHSYLCFSLSINSFFQQQKLVTAPSGLPAIINSFL